jgi:pyruvate formate lyase activating enzyme
MTQQRINLGGIVPFSTIDWRGKAALVIFFRGCPLRCIYCQNYNLLDKSEYVALREIEEEIQKNEGFIDAVVISGGEPFMQSEALAAVAGFVKEHSLSVGVQTCGFYPVEVELLLNRDLLDKVFLDIKAPLSDENRYRSIVQASGVPERVKKTLDGCAAAPIELELVTTVFKKLVGAEEVKLIAREIEEAGATHCPYVLQQGRAELVSGNVITEDDVFSRGELMDIAAYAYRAANLKDVRIRTREHGEEMINRRG